MDIALERNLTGRQIIAIDVRERRLRTVLRPAELRRKLVGRQIEQSKYDKTDDK